MRDTQEQVYLNVRTNARLALERRAVEDFIETPRHVDLARLDGDGNDLALNSPFTTWLRLVSKETTHFIVDRVAQRKGRVARTIAIALQSLLRRRLPFVAETAVARPSEPRHAGLFIVGFGFARRT